MGQAAGPHDLRPGLIVLGIVPEDPGILHDSAHQPLGQRVSELHVVPTAQIALHGVHEDVHTAAGRLVVGEGEGELRVHDGEAGAAEVVVIPPLHHPLVLGDHAAVAHLAARRRDGEHRTHRHTRRGPAGVVVEVPHVPLVGQAVADGLRGVDRAAAPHGQEEVHPLPAAQLDPLTDQGQPGIGHHAPQLHIGDPLPLQRGLDPVQQAGADHAAAAVVDQDLPGPCRRRQHPCLGRRAPAKDHPCRRIVSEVEHLPFPSLCWI